MANTVSINIKVSLCHLYSLILITFQCCIHKNTDWETTLATK